MNLENIPKNIDEFDCSFIEGIDFKVSFINSTTRIFYNSNDITDILLSPEVAAITAKLANHEKYFRALCDKVRKICYEQNTNFISDGRAVGSYIFPNATTKYYISAPVEVRALRRYKDYLKLGHKIEYKDVLNQLTQRDELDMKRSFAPLEIPSNSIIIDSSTLNIEEIVFKIQNEIHSELSVYNKTIN